MDLSRLVIDTPLGPFVIVASCAGLVAAQFEEHFVLRERRRENSGEHDPAALLAEAAKRLTCYFGGALDALPGLPLDAGGTAFQERAWEVLRGIAPGQTITYAMLAERSGVPGAIRAIAAANARNPLAIIVPCHRVIGAGGDLTGYGAGIERKRWLLAHEGALKREPEAAAR